MSESRRVVIATFRALLADGCPRRPTPQPIMYAGDGSISSYRNSMIQQPDSSGTRISDSKIILHLSGWK
jgi:hypothetical protein